MSNKKIKLKRKKKSTGTRKKSISIPKGKPENPPVIKVGNNNEISLNRVKKEPPSRKHGTPDGKNGQWPEWGEKFLRVFMKEKTIYHACHAMGISRDAVTRYKRHCKKFRDAFYDTKESLTDLIEQSAMNRAIHGNDKLVLHNGVPVMIQVEDEKGKITKEYLWEKKHETALTIFMLKGRRRDEYYPEMQQSQGSNDERAAAVLQVIAEISNIMAPPGKDDK